jgi:hypothetical protein
MEHKETPVFPDRTARFQDRGDRLRGQIAHLTICEITRTGLFRPARPAKVRETPGAICRHKFPVCNGVAAENRCLIRRCENDLDRSTEPKVRGSNPLGCIPPFPILPIRTHPPLAFLIRLGYGVTVAGGGAVDPASLLERVLDDEGLTAGLNEPEAALLIRALSDRVRVVAAGTGNAATARQATEGLCRRARQIATEVKTSRQPAQALHRLIDDWKV